MSRAVCLLLLSVCASRPAAAIGECPRDCVNDPVYFSCAGLGCTSWPHPDPALPGRAVAVVELQDNYLAAVPVLDSRTYGGLTDLNVSGNNIKILVNSTFAECQVLKSIDFSHNHIDIIEEAAFRDTPSLETVNLRDNRLESSVFSALSLIGPLRILDLSENRIQSLDRNLLTSMVNLKELNLAHNQLKSVPAMGHSHLEVLDLSENMIDSIEPGAFIDLYFLDMLHLEHNVLRDVPNIHANKVKFLNLSSNAIFTLRNDAFTNNTEEIEILDLSNNQLMHMEQDAFFGLKWLRTLILRVNKLETLTSNVFHTHLPYLQTIDLSHNELTSLSHNALTDLDDLYHLDLSHNRLTELVDLHLLGLSNLRTLSVHHNELTELGWGLAQECDELRVLDVSYNKVHSISDGVFYHRRGDYVPLETVLLRHVGDVRLVKNGTFAGLPELTEVDLSHNRYLNNIEVGAFHEETRLSALNLAFTNIGYMPPGLLDWQGLETLNVTANPWYCDCNLAWMKEQEPFNVKFAPQIRCEYPRFLRGHHVSDIPVDDFSCNSLYEHKWEVAMILVLSVSVVFLGTAVWGCVQYRRKVLPCFYKTDFFRSVYNPVYTEEPKVTIEKVDAPADV